MKISRRLLSASLLTAYVMTNATIPNAAHAASNDECAIWLCLPTGFPSGCGGAKKAFLNRIKKRKSPLPSFSSCAVKESEIPHELIGDYKPSDLTYKEGIAAKMPDGRHLDGQRCVKITRKGEVVTWKPYGCTATDSWVQTYMDGKQYGEKFYY